MRTTFDKNDIWDVVTGMSEKIITLLIETISSLNKDYQYKYI